MTRLRRQACVLLLVCAPGCVPLLSQTRLALKDVSARNPSANFVPSRAGEKVTVRGVVNAPAFRFLVPEYSLLAIEDGEYGAMLQVTGPDARLQAFRPGDDIEVQGAIAAFQGMPVIVPSAIELKGRRPPPVPFDVAAARVEGDRYLGRLVRIEIRVEKVTDAPNGNSIAAPGSFGIFIPRPGGSAQSLGFERGDTVRATGISYQYCPQPPFNRNYQLLVNDPSTLVRTDNAASVPLLAMLGAVALVLVLSFFWWGRERRLRLQRERLRKTYQLGEQVLGSSSSESILKRLRESLPAILGISRVHLYVLNRASKTLESVAAEDRDAASISLAAPPDGSQSGAVACFHYRTLLMIPDVERSPFPIGVQRDGSAKSLLFVPMLAQGAVIGVLELDQDDQVRDFTHDEQELAQHLGNQTGVALCLLDQRSVQEQLFRTEKVAAVGRLISGVVNELQAPLSSISDLAGRAQEKLHGGAAGREVAAISAEAQKAAAMVARLVSFASGEQEARTFPVNALLRNLIQFRESEWKASGIRVRDLTSSEPAFLLGLQGQLEQVFLNLFVHVEQTLAEAEHKAITIRTSVLARRLLVEISFSAPLASRKPEENAAVLGVTRSVIAGHGGEVRLIEKNGVDPVFEVELPVTTRERGASTQVSNGHAPDVVRMMTALVIDSDDLAQRQIMGLLASRGHRVVPVNNSDTGLDLAQRLRFDAAFVSVHAPGLNWVELSERLQSRVGAFVLISDGYDAELSSDFEGEGRFVLPKPVQEVELDRILRGIEPPVTAVRPVA